ncbi:MAG: hypothetical protein ACK6DI_12695 [Betaproteobacteria bacterium]
MPGARGRKLGVIPLTRGRRNNASLAPKSFNTFAKLAVAPVSTLQDTLTQAGPRFKLADPGTWPEQSRLAADNRWAELAALQDQLDAGVRRDV